MSFKSIRYAELYRCLTALGYHAYPAPTHVVYRKSGSTLPVVLHQASETEEVSPAHLAAVGRILELDGVIGRGQLALALDRATGSAPAVKSKRKTAEAERVKGTNAKTEGVKSTNGKGADDKPTTAVREALSGRFGTKKVTKPLRASKKH
jgi:hypothetical protein